LAETAPRSSIRHQLGHFHTSGKTPSSDANAPAVESGDDYLAGDGWEMERQQAIFDRGAGCFGGCVDRDGSGTQFSGRNQSLMRHQPEILSRAMQKTGKWSGSQL
jgi:hypothetical protein